MPQPIFKLPTYSSCATHINTMCSSLSATVGRVPHCRSLQCTPGCAVSPPCGASYAKSPSTFPQQTLAPATDSFPLNWRDSWAGPLLAIRSTCAQPPSARGIRPTSPSFVHPSVVRHCREELEREKEIEVRE
jgi:hypothetical protein